MMRSLHQALLFAQEEIRSLLYTQKWINHKEEKNKLMKDLIWMQTHDKIRYRILYFFYK